MLRRRRPAPSATSPAAGALPPGDLGVLAYAGQARSWRSVPVTIDPRRARVGCDTQIAVTTDGPLTVALAGCGRARTFG
jgi:hypothetical protein